MFRLFSFTAVVLLVSSATAQDSPKAAKHLLVYKLQEGEQLVVKVVHQAETQTTMSEVDENSSSITTSEKVWEVTGVNAKGEMTFDYRINSVKLSQTVGDGEQIEYDSSQDGEVPDMFKPVAETIGKTLATITINSRGQVVSRDKELKTPQLGMGELTIPLPANPITVGERWSVPREMRVKLDNGTQKKIKVRELYTLERVKTGVATISIVTQALTPVKAPAIEAQLIQQMSKGTIRFDIDRGRLISKRLDWSEEVLGFRGADTRIRYDGKFTEELVSRPRTATRPLPKKN